MVRTIEGMNAWIIESIRRVGGACHSEASAAPIVQAVQSPRVVLPKQPSGHARVLVICIGSGMSFL